MSTQLQTKKTVAKGRLGSSRIGVLRRPTSTCKSMRDPVTGSIVFPPWNHDDAVDDSATPDDANLMSWMSSPDSPLPLSGMLQYIRYSPTADAWLHINDIFKGDDLVIDEPNVESNEHQGKKTAASAKATTPNTNNNMMKEKENIKILVSPTAPQFMHFLRSLFVLTMEQSVRVMMVMVYTVAL